MVTYLVGVPSVPLSWKVFSSRQGFQIFRELYRVAVYEEQVIPIN